MRAVHELLEVVLLQLLLFLAESNFQLCQEPCQAPRLVEHRLVDAPGNLRCLATKA